MLSSESSSIALKKASIWVTGVSSLVADLSAYLISCAKDINSILLSIAISLFRTISETISEIVFSAVGAVPLISLYKTFITSCANSIFGSPLTAYKLAKPFSNSNFC